jgi:hypothetical protein
MPRSAAVVSSVQPGSASIKSKPGPNGLTATSRSSTTKSRRNSRPAASEILMEHVLAGLELWLGREQERTYRCRQKSR